MSKKENNLINKRLIRSYLSSGVSISLVLVLVGVVAIFAFNAKKTAEYFKENMVVSLIMQQSVTESQTQELQKELQMRHDVVSARFVSKEEGAQEMKSLLGEDFLSVFESNPIPLSIDLHLNGEVIEKDSLIVLKHTLLKDKRIKEVVYQESLVEVLNANLNKIGTVLLVVILLLLFISFVLINNTVRLSVYSKRFTIHTMSLVGAKRSYIRRPFIGQAALQGTISGLVAAALIAAGCLYLKRETPIFELIFDRTIVYGVLAGVVMLGLLICVVSSRIVVNKLAYLSTDDLYY